MKADEIFRFIPQETLDFLAAESSVNTQVKKLDGVTMFKLMLFSMMHTDKPSLRVMEAIFHSMQFKMVSGLTNETTKYNSIRDRISTINSSFFEQIFFTVFKQFNHYFKEEDAIVRYDSTMVAISSKLVQWGMSVGSKTNKVQLKYTVGMKGSFPCSVQIYDTPSDINENNTIPNAIFKDAVSVTGIVVFDRGVTERKIFAKLSEQQRVFVTRVNVNVRFKVIERLFIDKMPEGSTVTIVEDAIVYLRDGKHRWIKNEIRLIKGHINNSGEAIYFLTNIKDMSAYEIAAIYKQRWEIECFFKFLKQQLNLSHLITRNENGIKVMIYMTLILSILLIAYKKINKLSSYKIAKIKFSIELESEIVKQIVLLCGGNPKVMNHLFNDS
jgi:hypothetical protein